MPPLAHRRDIALRSAMRHRPSSFSSRTSARATRIGQSGVPRRACTHASAGSKVASSASSWGWGTVARSGPGPSGGASPLCAKRCLQLLARSHLVLEELSGKVLIDAVTHGALR
jgi:hypothetical protein